MSVEQKMISVGIHNAFNVTNLEETLNREAVEGWRLQVVSTVVTRKGGAIYVVSSAYFWDTYYCLLSKTQGHYEYRCSMLKRERQTEQDLVTINGKIDELAQEGFALMHIVHGTAVSADEERPTIGTIAHILIFEREKEE